MKSSCALLWFLFGLGSQLQIVASLSFTELFVFATAPILFFKERVFMKRDGIMPFFYFSLVLVCGCAIACVANQTQSGFVLRGMAVCCLMPCSIIVAHWLLRKDMAGLKWSFLGGAASGILCTFVFQKSVEVVGMSGGVVDANTAVDIMGGATYWIHRLGAFVTLPVKGWYLRCPVFYCVGAPLFMAAFSMLTSVSGRGSAARAIAAGVLVLIGGKRRAAIRNHICRGFWWIVLLAIVGVFSVKWAYQTAATQGWLGEQALAKYEVQTKGRTGFMALLLGGRMESFCGLLACIDKPIVGFGPWAIDTRGYQTEFLARYADRTDYENYLKTVAYAETKGISTLGLIPCHSVVTEFWLWYGLGGLVFCAYVFYAVLRYLRQDCWVIPQWYFWLGASAPGLFWDLCFNPFSDRVGLPLFVVACLMARAVRQGRFQLPYAMVREIEGNERKRK